MQQNNSSEYSTRYKYIIFSVLTLLYFLTRLYKLNHLPIFTDESVYIRWAQIIREDPSQFLISLRVDGKQPLFHWINALTVNLFQDPLFSIRMNSVVFGYLSMIALYHTGRLLHSCSAGVVAALLYIFTPYLFIHNRLGIAASLLSLFLTYALLFSIKISRNREGQLKLYIYLGLLLAAAFLTKTTALVYFLLVLPFIYLLNGTEKTPQKLYPLLISWFVAFFIIILINYGVSPPKEANALFHENRFILSMKELVAFPFDQWWKNGAILFNYIYAYLTLPLFLIVAGSLFYALGRRNRDLLALFLWFLLPVMVLLFMGKILFARYLVFTIPAALVIVSVSMIKSGEKLEELFKRFLGKSLLTKGIMVIILLPMLLLDYNIAANPVKAGFIEEDRFQYVSGWPSGYGISETVQFLKEKAKEKPVSLFLTTIWGNPNDALIIYLRNEPNINIYEAHWWYKSPIVPGNVKYAKIGKSKYLREVAQTLDFGNLGETYFVTDSNKIPSNEFLLKNRNFYKVASFYKPGEKYSVDIYKLGN